MIPKSNFINFSYPRNEEARKQWILVSKNYPNVEIKKYSTICSEHFTFQDFSVTNEKNILLPHAVPKIPKDRFVKKNPKSSRKQNIFVIAENPVVEFFEDPEITAMREAISKNKSVHDHTYVSRKEGSAELSDEDEEMLDIGLDLRNEENLDPAKNKCRICLGEKDLVSLYTQIILKKVEFTYCELIQEITPIRVCKLKLNFV